MKALRRLLAVIPACGLIASAQIVTPANSAGGLSAIAVSVTTPATSTISVTPVVPPRITPVGTAPVAQTTGETSIALDVSFGIRAVPPARVSVPVGEFLRVTAPSVSAGISYTWTKNGRAIEGQSTNVLLISHVVSDDAGTYACLFSAPTQSPQSSQALVLGVGPTERLLNLSTRANVGSGADQGLISGFVVGGSAREKKLIVRAIGPSLSLFGVNSALRAPILRIFDSSSRVYQNAYVYPAVVGGPTYESDLAESLARAGAFPVPAGTRDAILLMPFAPGSYTAQITSGDNSTGNVLLEIYEVP